MSDINGKVVIVTGASRGSGAATVRAFLVAGASVLALSRSGETPSGLEGSDCLRSKGDLPRCLARQCDVADYESVETSFDEAQREFGRIDFLVNNAGVIDPISPFHESDPQLWSRAIDVNVKGVYNGMRLALNRMRFGEGVIVNLSSGAATGANLGWSHYCASKAAAKRLTECAEKERDLHGIRVVGISPGTVATDMMADIRDSGLNPVSQLDWSVHIPPDWVARAIVFLCGPGGADYAGTDFTLKTDEGRRAVGLPLISAQGAKAPE